MKSFLKISVCILAIGLVFSSCSKKNEAGKMIPKNAMIVLQVETKYLKEKLPWDEIKQTSWFNKINSDSAASGWAKNLLNNPDSSGIDFDGGLVFFIYKIPGTDGQFVLEGSLKNENNFEAFNKNFDPASSIKTDGGISTLSLKDEGAVAWDNKHFAYAFDAGSAKSKLNALNPQMGNLGNLTPIGNSPDLSSVCRNLFSLKSDSSLSGNEKFANLLKEKGDIHTWINTEAIANSSSAMGMVGMLKLDAFLKDNVSTYTVNFDNGKINISHKGYAGKEFSDILKNYSGSGINTDMFKNIPSKDILGILALNFKPEGIKELIKLTGLDGFVNTYAGKAGFNLDDFVKANKGDLMVTFTDLNIKNDSSTKTETPIPAISKKPEMNFLFSVGIGDKSSFQKLVDAGKKISNDMGKGNDTSIAYGQNDKVFAISNHQHFLNDYLAGNASNSFDFLSKLSGHPIGFFLDIHKLLSTIAGNSSINDEDEKVVLNESLSLWKDIYVTGGDFKDGGITSSTEVNFMDQNTNSLKQLNHYFDVIAKTIMNKMEKEKSGMNNIDSLIVPPPMDTVGHK